MIIRICNIIKISGCRDNQYSMDAFDNKSKTYQGALTNLVLQNIDLPPERTKILRGYVMTKKWEMISNHVRNSQLF